jgi:hypothetical protein
MSSGEPRGQPYGQQPEYGQGSPYGAQPEYGQPQPRHYGPPGTEYGPPGSQYSAPPLGYEGGYIAPAHRQSIGIVSLVMTATGALLVLVAFLLPDWFRNTGSGTVLSNIGDQSTFREISDAYDKIKGQIRAAGGGAFLKDLHFGIGPTYFGWLAWVLLAVTVLFAVVAALPTSAATAFRWLGAGIAIVAIALTFWAIYLISVTGQLRTQIGGSPRYSDFLSHTAVGFYLAVGGFLLIAIGALIGPRRRA